MNKERTFAPTTIITIATSAKQHQQQQQQQHHHHHQQHVYDLMLTKGPWSTDSSIDIDLYQLGISSFRCLLIQNVCLEF